MSTAALALPEARPDWHALALRARARRRLSTGLLYAAMALGALPILVPYLWLVTVAFSGRTGASTFVLWRTLAVLLPAFVVVSIVGLLVEDRRRRRRAFWLIAAVTVLALAAGVVVGAEVANFGNADVVYATQQVEYVGQLWLNLLRMTIIPLVVALLVTGNDFDYEQGVGAVEVGTYIAPRLFVSYGVGLFEDQNVISARYDLKKGFGIKATSGQRETGVDISYTIER